MIQTDSQLSAAMALVRGGDLAAGRALLEAALADAPTDRALLGLAGIVAGQLGDTGAAIAHFRRLLELAPQDRGARINLTTALIAGGELEEALAVARPGEGEIKLRRLVGYICQQLGRLDEAEAAYREVVAAVPSDYETWNNLGNVCEAKRDIDGAIVAFERAINLRRDAIPIYINLARTLTDVDRDEARLRTMIEAARIAPDDPQVQLELGLAHSVMRDFDAAEQAYRAAIRNSAGFTPAFLEFGLLLERLNRFDEIEALVEEARSRGAAGPEVDFIRALCLRRQGRSEEALALAEATPPTINRNRRAHLLAQLYDSVGDVDSAYAAYVEMNEAALAARRPAEGPTFIEKVAAGAALLTPERVAAWRPIAIDRQPPAPIFLIGFPRSGTTLLDTLLMNLPNLHVLEEVEVVPRVEDWLGGDKRIASLTDAEANALRQRYFEVLDELEPAAPGQTIVDKYPLHMVRMPFIHRIFPEAKVIFAERHPCDCVLSCFASNFNLNQAMLNFVTLDGAARFYDTVFDAWTRARDLLPIDVHHVRYERMVADAEGEMRGLLDFLGLPWDPKVLDNQGSAARRAHIRTPSYSQVTQPIYNRSAGRWQRYRKFMEPVLPILAPWAERMGYEI